MTERPNRRLIGLRGQRKVLRDAIRAVDRDGLEPTEAVVKVAHASAGALLAIMDHMIAEHMEKPERDYEKESEDEQVG